MKHGNKIEKFVSVFLFASMAFSFMSPQINGNSSIPKQSYSTTTLESLFNQTLDQSLDQPLMEQNVPASLVGETSFIALKTPYTPFVMSDSFPPQNTKIVVVSRMKRMVTAYSSTPDQTDSTPFITASNTHVRDGIVAANFARFRTKIRFPTLYGDKIFVVEDRMNKRYPHRVDIWMETRQEAKQFGVKAVPVEIVKEI